MNITFLTWHHYTIFFLFFSHCIFSITHIFGYGTESLSQLVLSTCWEMAEEKIILASLHANARKKNRVKIPNSLKVTKITSLTTVSVWIPLTTTTTLEVWRYLLCSYLSIFSYTLLHIYSIWMFLYFVVIFIMMLSYYSFSNIDNRIFFVCALKCEIYWRGNCKFLNKKLSFLCRPPSLYYCDSLIDPSL